MENTSFEILLIENDPAAARVIVGMLAESRREKFSVQHVRYLAEGLSLLENRRFDLILVDMGLPDSRGLETALAVREHSRLTPIVVLTVPDDEDTALKSLQMDIQDYLVKGEISSSLLIRSIRYAIQRQHDMEALRQSEQRLASFMLHLPAAAWAKDPMGRYVYGNAEHGLIFSMPFSEYSGKSDEEFLPPETARQLRENDERVLAEGESLQTIEVLRRANGMEHHFIVSKFPIPGPDGQAAFVAGIAQDITERVKAEKEIERLNAQLAARARQSEERFEAFMNNLPAAAWMKDLAGRYVYANAQAECNFGRPFAEFSGKTDGEFLPPETAGKLRENDARVLAEEKALQTTEIVPLPSGVDLYHAVSKFPVPGTDGRTAYVGGVAFDITELVRTEKALHFSEERFRALVTATSQVLYRMSPDWSELRQLTSTKFLADTEAPSSDWLQKYIPPDEQPQVTAVIQEAIRTKSIFELEHRVLRADGSLGWTLSRAIPLLDANGEIIEWFGAANDVTERVEAERAELAARAAELEDANRELEAFNYTVAHDLRKPLTVINGYCQAIKELCSDKLGGQCAGYLQEAYEGTLRMNRLIEALLNFSRLAHVELRMERLDLSAMAHEVVTELRLAAPGRRVIFRIAEGIMADGDANLVRVVLDNLLGNAWKYTGAQEEGIIEFGVTEIDGKPACFVRDNGPGFAMSDADKLFTPFQRLPGAEAFKGFGIGLATVERIIRRHGGRVWAEGEPGKGATFWFTLPREVE